MPTAVKTSLDSMMSDSGELERSVPPCLGKVPKDLVRNFPHTKRVGSYLVGKMINKGSFAKVMEGMHISTGEKVAIKVIDKKKARQDSYVLKNMKREPRIHQMIRHPNIVLLLETLETENCYYMAMELCSGGDLMDRICDQKRLEEREVRRYTRQILSAVDHLHTHGIVHRDLKIENFLLDEHNNIKIVDFGLSNTLKVYSLSPELLNTQCGSPAYAAPELLAHRKYGPKVDVWSVGVSMFAMLTGTLPFTVEPFNIKQLHQKMVNGEISTIPSDISKGAVQFVLSLLEPDPLKRPTVKAAMEEKWLNEGYAKRPLHTVSYKNRLRPEDLNSSVLNYMSESLGYGLSDIIHTVINNKPSTILATYQLLLKKMIRQQKVAKTMKKVESSDWNQNKPVWNERNNTPAKSQQQSPQSDTTSEGDRSRRQSSKTPHIQSQDRDSLGSRRRPEEAIRQKQPSSEGKRAVTPSTPLADAFIDNDFAISMETREGLFPEVSLFGERELVHASPPKCSCREGSGSKLCDSTPSDAPVTVENKKDSQSIKPAAKPHDLRVTHPEDYSGEELTHLHDDKLEKLQTFYSEKAVSPRTHFESRAGQRFKDLLLAIEEKTHPARHLSAMETTVQTSPLPRLRHGTVSPKKVTWVGLKHHAGTATGSSPFLVNGSKPPVFPTQRQQALVIKSLRHSKEKRNGMTGGSISVPGHTGKRNSVQLRTFIQRRDTDLNLPMLPSTYHNKPEKKTEILRMDFG
uniref:non-specific serine/threonine protein kinase n=1 Tax=Astyanax mexicanus TaxID=7994 RepID=W5KAC7_ASTMX